METMKTEEASNQHSELNCQLKLNTQFLTSELIQILLILREVSNRLRQFVAISLRIQLVDTKHGITTLMATMKTEEALNQHLELKLILKVSPKPNLRENLCYLTLNIIVMLLHIQSTTQYQTSELIQILFQPKPISKTLRKKWEEKSRPHQPVVKVLGITRLNSMTTLEASFQIL